MTVELDTDRLILRRFAEDDADLIVDLDADPDAITRAEWLAHLERDENSHEVSRMRARTSVNRQLSLLALTW